MLGMRESGSHYERTSDIFFHLALMLTQDLCDRVSIWTWRPAEAAPGYFLLHALTIVTAVSNVVWWLTGTNKVHPLYRALRPDVCTHALA